MRLRSTKAACYLGAVMVVALTPLVPVIADAGTAYEQKSAITETVVKTASYSANTSEEVETGYETEQDSFYNRALAITSPYLEVFSEASADSEIVGRLYENTVVDTEEVSDGWTLISSGNVRGYVQTQYLLFGEEAEAITTELDESQILTAYTVEEAEAKEAQEAAEAEAARKAAEEAEAARRAAEEAEAARKAAIIANTIDGTEFTYNPTITLSDEEIWILACVIDWEAGTESYEGKLAVANVVLNRLRSGYWGSTIQSVVYAKSQFSGVSNGSGSASTAFSNRLSTGPYYSDCMTAALAAISGTNNIGSYTSFRTVSSANLSSISNYVIIGSHVFY